MRFPPLLILIGIMSGVDAAEQGALTETELTAAAARIDEVVLRTREKEIQSAQRWQRAESKVPPPATDQAFLRRTCIDLAGRLPLATEVRAFLADASEDKRQRLIDQLVLEPTAAEARFRRLAEALRVTDTVGKTSQAPFIAWLRAAMVEDMPYDQLMAVMLRASGDVSQDPAAGLLQRDEGDILHTSIELARAFLGADLHCAQCHDHPYNDYTQRGCYEFATCFAGAPKPSVNAAKTAVKPKTLFPGAISFGRGSGQQQAVAVGSNRGGLTLPPSYLYRDGKPGEVVQPRYLLLDDLPGDGPRSAFTARPSPGAKLREQVALWFTGPQNERFAAVGAWRVWNHLFGSLSPFGARREGEAGAEAYHSVIQRRGCDMPPSWNPVSWNDWLFDRKSASAEAVSTLGVEFKRCGYRLREFQRILARTQAYQAEASAVRFPFGPGLIDAAPALRRLPPEVIWDAWVRWLPESDDDARPSVDLPQVPPVTHPLRLLGRGTREWADETVPVISHGLARFIMNSPFVERVAHSRKPTAAEIGPSAQVEELFLDTLGRFPIERETAAALRHLAGHPQSGAQDIAWALLNTAEFLFVP